MESRKSGEGGDDAHDDGKLLVQVVEDEGNVVKIGARERRERSSSSVKSGNERNDGEGEKESGEGATLFEAVSDYNGEIGVMKRKNNVFGVVIEILEGANNVRRAVEELEKVPEIGTAKGGEGIVHVKKASGGRRGGGGGNKEGGFHLEEGIKEVLATEAILGRMDEVGVGFGKEVEEGRGRDFGVGVGEG